jgi:hypothetical protein
VRYEDLIQDHETSLKKVSKFLSVEYKTDMLDYWKNPLTMENRNYDYKNLGKPNFSEPIGIWKERLSEDQQSLILKKISPELQDLGFID